MPTTKVDQIKDKKLRESLAAAHSALRVQRVAICSDLAVGLAEPEPRVCAPGLGLAGWLTRTADIRAAPE